VTQTTTCLDSPDLTDAQFLEISALVKRLCGLNLHRGKRQLVKSRLIRRIRQLGLPGFREYIEYLQADESGGEVTEMLNALSTNVTRFFRENDHFDYLADTFIPEALTQGGERNHRMKFWSAGCSSGEEPYTLAILLSEAIADLETWDVRILATDISSRMIERAREGIYNRSAVRDVPPLLLQKHFAALGPGPERRYRIGNGPRRLVRFAKHNLISPWPMRGLFDAIFCRNVMIYFDKETQAHLVRRFGDLLGPGGLLFIGHSESLVGVEHRLTYVRPMVYRKDA